MVVKKLRGFDDVDPVESDEPKDPEEVTVDIDEEDDEDEPEPDKAATRQGKKNSRYWMNREKEEQLIRENAEYKARAEAQERMNQQLGMLMQRLPQQQQPQQQNPIDLELDRLDQEELQLQERYRMRYADTKSPLTQAEIDEMNKHAQRIGRGRSELAARKVIQQSGIRPQEDQTMAAARAYVVNRYPEASQNQQALGVAQSKQMELVALGKPMWSVETIDAAMDHAERTLRIGKHRNGAGHAPDPGLRERLSSTPRGSGSGGGSAKGGGGNEVVMTKQLRAMADKAFPYIKDPDKRYKKFAKVHAGKDDE